MNRLFLICILLFSTTRHCKAEDDLWRITKDAVRDAVNHKYAIVDTFIEESHLAAVGTRSEGMAYTLKCFDTLLNGDPMIQTKWTSDYQKKAVLKRRRYILILDGSTYLHAEKVDSTGERQQEILRWIKEIKSEK